MPDADSLATIIAAIVGAAGGSVGATIVGNLFRHRSKRTSQLKNLVNRYFLQLQDATESLWFRLDNIKKRGQADIEEQLSREYYQESTVYAFACFLAYKTIMDGVYSQIVQLKPDVGSKLKDKLIGIEEIMEEKQDGKHQFYNYDRLALAEAVMEKSEQMAIFVRLHTYNLNKTTVVLDWKARPP